MPRTLYHFELDIQGESLHGYYTSLEALILDNWETLTVSRSTLQKFFSSKKENDAEYRGDDWVIRKSTASTAAEVRAYLSEIEKISPYEKD